MDGWTDKDSKDPTYRALYERLPFVEAYAQHTDMRAARNGAEGAIGRADEWETHGVEQLEFLRSRGLLPSNTLLDLGCGSGRLARWAVPYLDHGRYLGLDISPAVLDHATRLSVVEGWAERLPRFFLGDGTLARIREVGEDLDMVWAHSVVTHLPPELVRGLFAELAGMRFGQFLFTYKPAPEGARRSGLKQFQYHPMWLIAEAESAGLAAECLGRVWPAKQRTMRVWRP